MDRKRVFKLMAMGRINAAEAERLMAVWQAGRESTWILAGCVGVALVAELRVVVGLPVVEHLVHTLRVSGLMHGVVEMVMRLGNFS